MQEISKVRARKGTKLVSIGVQEDGDGANAIICGGECDVDADCELKES